MKKLLFLLILFPCLAFAEENEHLPEIDYFSDFFNMLITFVFVIVLIVGTTWFLKKFTRSRMRHLNGSTNIKVLERRVLNQKSSLYLVDILGKGIVIAESQQGIHLISEFPSGTNIEQLIEEQLPEQKPTLSFGEILAKLKTRYAKSSK